MDNSIMYKIGQVIEPVTKIFGLGWKTFMAFIVSSLCKEGAIGVLSTIAGGAVAALRPVPPACQKAASKIWV